MIGFGARSSYLRAREGHHHHRVEFIELFFDLVFVFAVTQLSHGLLEHLDAPGAVKTAFLLAAVWWVWINTSWMTNWVDPATHPVRLMLFAMMLLALAMSSSIPQAFDERAVPFVWAYVTLQLGRTLFMLWALRRHWPGELPQLPAHPVLDRGGRRAVDRRAPTARRPGATCCGRWRCSSSSARRRGVSGRRGSAVRRRATG